MTEDHKSDDGPSWPQITKYLLGVLGTFVIGALSWHWSEVRSLRLDLAAQKDSNYEIHQRESMERAVLREQLRQLVENAGDAKAWRQSMDSRINELLMRQSSWRARGEDFSKDLPKFAREAQFSASPKER